MVDWHDIAFSVPKLGSLSDQQLQQHYIDRDGRWSDSIKAAMRRFETGKLDLDDNWASRSPNWECPACERRKPDLVRLSANGVLLARLDIHHDHLADHLKAILHAQLGPQWRSRIPADTAHIEALGARLVARFEPTMICSDCNSADGAVKSRVRDLPRSFSFRPSEIRRFVTPRPNREHQLDLDVARTLFADARHDFERRLALTEMLAQLVLAGEMTREAGNLPPAGTANPMSLMRHLHDWLARKNHEQYGVIYGDLAAFEARSISRDGVASNIRKTSRPTPRPTAEEVATYDGGGAPELWQAAPLDWHCAGCHRDRTDILRQTKNRNRKWSGKLVRHTEFVVAVPEADDDFEPYVDHHELHLICMDCASILPGVKSRRPGISVSSATFQIRDMWTLAKAAPNAPHDVDWSAAAERAAASLPLASLVADYWKRHNRAIGCRESYQSYLSFYGGDAKRAWTRLKLAFALELEGLDDPDEYLDLLLHEADRIAVDDPWRSGSSLPPHPGTPI